MATATDADPAPLARMVDDLEGLSPEDAAAHLTNFVHEANYYLDIYISGFLAAPEFDAVVRAISDCNAKIIVVAETALGPRMNAMLNLFETSGAHVYRRAPDLGTEWSGRVLIVRDRYQALFLEPVDASDPSSFRGQSIYDANIARAFWKVLKNFWNEQDDRATVISSASSPLASDDSLRLGASYSNAAGALSRRDLGALSTNSAPAPPSSDTQFPSGGTVHTLTLNQIEELVEKRFVS